MPPRFNPAAPVFKVDDVGAEQLLSGVSYDPALLSRDARAWLAAEAVEDAAHAHHGHRHDVNRHDARIRAFSLSHARPISPHALALFTELVRSAHGAQVLRFKGLVAASDDPSRPIVVHGVQHVMHPPTRLPAWPDDDHTTRMVFIVRDLDPAFMEGLWLAALGEPRVDRADLRTLADNPLAPAPGGLLG